MFIYANMFGLDPEHPRLKTLSDEAAQLYVLARLKVLKLFSGQETSAPSSSFEELAMKRLKEQEKKKTETTPVTLEELGWDK